TLGGFYYSMLYNKKKQEEEGRNPYYEQVIAHVSKKPLNSDALQPLQSHPSELPPAFPGKDHYSGHATRSNWKNTQGYAEHGDDIRLMETTPQRTGAEGRPYTKSPDYVKNYGKTQRPNIPQRNAQI
ncbi:hypothetical protein BDN70DRAFT_813616, partial [Pholiota conissans]